MIKPDQRTRLQQISRLRLAADTLDWLRNNRPDLHRLNLLPVNTAIQLRALAEAYEANPIAHFAICKECREGKCKVHTTAPLRAHDLLSEPRKPPQRVAMSRRRPTLVPKKTAPIHFMSMDAQELIEVGRRELAKQGKSPNHRRKKPMPHAAQEFDEEAAHEEGQTFGHDVPDGSD